MIKRVVGRHAISDAVSKSGQMHNAQSTRWLGSLTMQLVGSMSKKSGDNMFTVLSGSKPIEGRSSHRGWWRERVLISQGNGTRPHSAVARPKGR